MVIPHSLKIKKFEPQGGINTVSAAFITDSKRMGPRRKSETPLKQQSGHKPDDLPKGIYKAVPKMETFLQSRRETGGALDNARGDHILALVASTSDLHYGSDDPGADLKRMGEVISDMLIKNIQQADVRMEGKSKRWTTTDVKKSKMVQFRKKVRGENDSATFRIKLGTSCMYINTGIGYLKYYTPGATWWNPGLPNLSDDDYGFKPSGDRSLFDKVCVGNGKRLVKWRILHPHGDENIPAKHSSIPAKRVITEGKNSNHGDPMRGKQRNSPLGLIC